METVKEQFREEKKWDNGVEGSEGKADCYVQTGWEKGEMGTSSASRVLFLTWKLPKCIVCMNEIVKEF